MHALLRRWPHTVIETRSGVRRSRPLVYKIQPSNGVSPVYVFGSYATVCGGVDTITDYKTIVPELLRRYASQGHVLFEGMLMSGTYGTIGACLTELEQQKHEVLIGFLDTPIEVCLTRINARRAARGKLDPVNPKNTVSKHNQTLGARVNFERRGHQTVTLNHRDAYRQVVRILGLPELSVR